MIDLIIIAICGLLLIKYLIAVAPFVPTWSRDLPRIATIVEQYNCQHVCDLGSGIGRILNYLARRFPDRKFTGIDLAITLVFFSRWRLRKLANCQILFGNFFTREWQEYDCLFMFWTPRAFVRYEERFLAHLHSGQIVVSYAFPILYLADKLVLEDRPAGQLPLFVYKY